MKICYYFVIILLCASGWVIIIFFPAGAMEHLHFINLVTFEHLHIYQTEGLCLLLINYALEIKAVFQTTGHRTYRLWVGDSNSNCFILTCQVLCSYCS